MTRMKCQVDLPTFKRNFRVLPFGLRSWCTQETAVQPPRVQFEDKPPQASQLLQSGAHATLLQSASADERFQNGSHGVNAGSKLSTVVVTNCRALGKEEPPVPGDAGNEADRSVRARRLRQEIARLQKVEAEQQRKLDDLGAAREKLEIQAMATHRSVEAAEKGLEEVEFPMQGRIGVKKGEISELEEQIAEFEQYIESLTRSYEHRKADFMRQIREREEQKELLKRAILQMERTQKKKEVPPGPECLSFVDGDLFSNIAALVILSNLLLMTIELIHGVDYEGLDKFFLLFYMAELALKLIYKQRSFLCGSVLMVWGNWLDLVIVLSSVSGALCSLLAGGVAQGGHFLAYLRFLRLARLARILRLIYIFRKSDLSWVEGHRFQTFMMCVIAINTALMGLEVQFHSPLWPVAEHVLLLIYTFELLVRMKSEGSRFLCSQKDLVWNWLDFIIVAGAIIDMWLMPATVLTFGMRRNGKALGQVMAMLRMFRLFRILRLIRLVKNIPPLYTLVIGITQTMQGMGWVLVLTMLVLYICALVGCKLIGQGLALAHLPDGPDKQEVMDTFPGIPEAVFNLFQAMNGDLGRLEPMLQHVPSSKSVMMIFMIVTNWAIFSILTAVVSDNMAKVTLEHDEELREEERAAARARCRERLTKIFDSLDEDGSNGVDEKRFMAMLNDDILRDEVCTLTGLSAEDVRDVFEIIATQKRGCEEFTISREEFLKCVDRENREVTLRSMMKLEKRLTSMEHMLCQALQLQPVRCPTPKILGTGTGFAWAVCSQREELLDSRRAPPRAQ